MQISCGRPGTERPLVGIGEPERLIGGVGGVGVRVGFPEMLAAGWRPPGSLPEIEDEPASASAQCRDAGLLPRELQHAQADATIKSITDLATHVRRSSRVH